MIGQLEGGTNVRSANQSDVQAVRIFESIASRRWSEKYQRIIKVSQLLGCEHDVGVKIVILLGHRCLSIGQINVFHLPVAGDEIILTLLTYSVCRKKEQKWVVN